MLNYTCYICDFRTEDRKAYISHVKEVHGEFIKRHVLAHKYGGVVPVCKECGAEVAFNEKQIDFNSYCVNHKKLAQIEWSKNNGFGAKMDPKQNLGKTKEDFEFLRRKSESMMGKGVKVFSPEEIKENTAKRLATEAERGSRILKDEKWERWCAESLKRGMRVVSARTEKTQLKDDVTFRCEICGNESRGSLMMFCQNRKEQTFGCKICTHRQIAEKNGNFFRKTEGPWNEFISKVRTDLKLEVLTPYKDYVNNQQKLEVLCLNCGKTSFKNSCSLRSGNRCYFCSKQGKSAWEAIVKSAIESKGYVVLDHVRLGRKEIDLLVDTGGRRVGIELNGLYWHCELEKEPGYHVNKYLAAEKEGISLLQFFEDEWRDHPELVTNTIIAELGGLRTIPISSCSVSVEQEPTLFYEENCLLGSPRKSHCSVTIRLDGEIIAAISIRPATISKHGSELFEISRYVTKPGLFVQGGLEAAIKMFKCLTFPTPMSGLIYGQNLRFGAGEQFEEAGFVLVERSEADYSYTDFENRFSRFSYKATTTQTERERAEQDQVFKIFGVGSKIFVRKI
jgi:hypothetical protein